MKHELMKLPYDYSALEPHMSKETLQYHHDKHHQTYVDKLNKLIEGTEYENKDLIEIIMTSRGGIFNNSAQIFNHNFFFEGLTPKSTQLSPSLKDAIDKSFGSFDKFKEEFNDVAANTFGSGWAWLVVDGNDKLSIVSKSNAGTPLTDSMTPLLCCDVWEHAYYIDTRNSRPKYFENFWNIVNWDFVSRNYETRNNLKK